MIQMLLSSALQVIESYWNLKAAEGKVVRCPYFRNPRSGRERWGLAVYAGKGSAKEIEEELKIVEKLEGADFSKMHEEEIRDTMKKRKLGIECSGFIAHVLDAFTRDFYKKPIYRLVYFKERGIGRLFCKMRPYTHIDVETLVSVKNARQVDDAQNLVPGDLIRFNTVIDHAAIITRTVRDESGKLTNAHYAQSVLEEERVGVKKGMIEFIRPSESLLAQKWSEEPDTGHTINERGEPRVYRLFLFER